MSMGRATVQRSAELAGEHEVQGVPPLVFGAALFVASSVIQQCLDRPPGQYNRPVAARRLQRDENKAFAVVALECSAHH
jgi:hypothetical protein